MGDGYRWYDLAYRLLSHLLRQPKLRGLPAFVRKWAASAINFLHPFNMHHLHQAWSKRDPSRNLFVEEDEHVHLAGIWVVELFPPSELQAFERALRKNGWQRRDRFAEDNSEVLQRSRAIESNTWWQVVDLHQKDARWRAPNGKTADLPEEFDSVGLRAVQIGTGLTAVVANFILTEKASKSLDEVWRSQHEPLMQWHAKEGRFRSLDRLSSGIWKTQERRRDLHFGARSWLKKATPGFFATNNKPQPILDLLLFEQFDPLAEPYVEESHEEWSQQLSALRALGIGRYSVYHKVSQNLPGLVLSSHDNLFEDPLAEDPTWSLWGKHGAVVEALGDLVYTGFGNDTKRAIAYRIQNMYPLLVMLAVSKFLDATALLYAQSRDQASTRHARFKPSRLQELRETLLTLSLDLTTVQRDIRVFWKDNAKKIVRFEIEPSPRTKFNDARRGYERPSIESMNERMETEHKERFDLLVEIDRDYRDILATVASLGASADSTRTGRLALWVALVSLGVTALTMLLSNIGDDSLLYRLLEALAK